METDYKEYPTFMVTDRSGNPQELAVIDEFEFENKNYVAAARVDGDKICEDGLYIYRVRVSEEDFKVEKITNPIDYQKVAEAYLEMDNQ